MDAPRWPQWGSRPQPDDLRASDSDRDRTAEVLRDAAGEGRLSLEELEDRLEQTYSAKTYAELARVTADLPVEQGPSLGGRSTPNDVARPGPSEITAFLSEQKVTGRWLVPRHVTARTFLGSVTLDLTQAALPHEVVLDVQVFLGELKLIVPDDIAVVMEPSPTILGERSNASTAEYAPGTPVVRVRGPVMLGELKARPPKRRWFGRPRG
jgi:hypothetical protein